MTQHISVYFYISFKSAVTVCSLTTLLPSLSIIPSSQVTVIDNFISKYLLSPCDTLPSGSSGGVYLHH